MSWQLLLLISIFSLASATLVQRSILKTGQKDPIAFSIAFQFLTAIVVAVYSFIKGFGSISILPILLNIVLLAVLYALGNVFKFKSLKITEASKFTIIFQSKAVWTIVIAVLLLGENFSFKQVIGTALILFSVVLVSSKITEKKFGKGELFALASAAFFGLAFANDTFIVRVTGVPFFIILPFLLPSLMTCLIFPSSVRKMGNLFDKKSFPKLLISSVLYGVGAIAVYEAYFVGRNIAQIAPIQETVTIVTVILAMIFLKERTHPAMKILAVILSFAGVLLLK